MASLPHSSEYSSVIRDRTGGLTRMGANGRAGRRRACLFRNPRMGLQHLASCRNGIPAASGNVPTPGRPFLRTTAILRAVLLKAVGA